MAKSKKAKKPLTVKQQAEKDYLKLKGITVEEANAIMQVRNGADVYSRFIAGTLRGLQRRRYEGRGKLFQITVAMNPPTSVRERQPYFGAIATPRGIALAKMVLKFGG